MQQPPKTNPQYRQFMQSPPQQRQEQSDYTQPQSYQQQPTRPPQLPLQQPPPSQTSRPWWISLIILAVIFVPYFLSKSGFHFPSTTTTAPTINASTSGTSAVSNTPTPFTVGQQVTVGYWNVSVNSAKTSHGDDVSSPKSGTIYLVIDVTVINISGSNQLMASAYYFRLTDSTGQPYDEQFTDFGGPPEGTIIPNGKLRGQLIYEVPTLEHAFTLQVLGGNSTDSAVAVWSIKD